MNPFLNRTATRTTLLAALLAVTLAPAQPPVSLYGGVFRPGQSVRIGVSAPARTELRLGRVEDPLAVFGATTDPHSPQLPPGTKVTPVRTLSTGTRDYGDVNLGPLPSGLYVLRAGGVGTLLLVSDLGLAVKRDRAGVLAYTADRASGRTRVSRVWQVSGSAGSEAVTNSDGVARFRVPPDRAPFFLARAGSEWAVSGGNWNTYAAPRVRGHVYTDRPVYRPGQRVEFKGVVRFAQSLRPVAGEEVRVTIFSPFSEEVQRRTLRTGAGGDFTGALDLPEGARVGEYRFEVRVPGAGTENPVGGTFAVEEYQKPEYAVTVAPERTRAVQGERVSVRVSARYLFGGGVGGARVTYNVTRAPYYPPGFDTDSLPEDPAGRDYGSDLVVREQARLDARGDLVVDLPLERDEAGRPVSYRVEAEVEDESRRTVSGFARLIAFPASLNVEARTDGYVYDVGRPIALSLDTRDLGGVARAAPVTVDLVRQTYEKVGREYRLRETREARLTTRTDARGLGRLTLRARRGGGYLIRASVQDARGRTSTFENFAWVLSPGEDWGWSYREMTVRMDRRTYAPGETAVALIGNPTPGAAVLVTVEGDRLRRATVLRGTGATLTYRFPVTADMRGDVFVGATAFGAGNFYNAQARVRVPVTDAALNVRVTPSRPRFRPGETGRVNVQVTDARGRGVPAELSLGVVDGAIYLVRSDTAPTLLSVFHPPRENVVGTESSAYFYFETGRLPAPRAAMTDAAFAQGKAAAPDAVQPPEDRVREDFRDTIVWVPNLVTDASGRASVDVRFPDNLTTWVATARVSARGGAARFGQATGEALVTKDVIARLALPPFLVRGDTATLAGVAQNTLPRAVEGRVDATLSGLAGLRVPGAGGQTVRLSPDGRVRTDLGVRALGPGTASVTYGVRTPGGSDRLKLDLTVKARGYDVTRAVTGGAGQGVTLTVPADFNLDTARLRVLSTPSLLSAVTPALEYLVGFPYGCTEQTMSRFLPALLAREALGERALPADVRRDLPEITAAGVARLVAFQHDDGGWGFWEFDDSTTEMTAYVARGLVRARALGVKVDNAVLDRALTYLARRVRDGRETQGAVAAAHRTLALAGRVSPDLAVFARRGDLQPYSLAQLALAADHAGQATLAGDLLDRLLARRTEGRAGVFWQKSRTTTNDDWFDFWDDNDVQTTATALEALARLAPDHAVVPRVGQWLLAARRGPRWVSTQDTTSVVIAALALRRPTAEPTAAPTVTINGRTVGRGADLTLNAAALRGVLRPGANTVRVEGAAGLSFSAELRGAREPARLGGDATGGLRLTRTYERLEPVWNDGEKRYTYRRVPLSRGGGLTPVTVGDLVLVTVTVRPEQPSARYLLVSDPIPAGTRALDERSLAISGLPPGEGDPDAWNFWYAGRELRDDRVDLYATYLRGTQKMTYVLRAQTPGTFTALPTHAFLMYDPDVEGFGAAATLTVRDRGQ